MPSRSSGFDSDELFDQVEMNGQNGGTVMPLILSRSKD